MDSSPKVNVIVRLELELAYADLAVQHFSPRGHRDPFFFSIVKSKQIDNT